MVLYMEVTDDEFELPLVVEESQKELAERLGLDRSSISNHLRLVTKNKRKRKRKIIKVFIDGEEEIETRI